MRAARTGKILRPMRGDTVLELIITIYLCNVLWTSSKTTLIQIWPSGRTGQPARNLALTQSLEIFLQLLFLNEDERTDEGVCSQTR
jgi:hypothetical protein